MISALIETFGFTLAENMERCSGTLERGRIWRCKQYQVCICRKEKRTEADSGISKNYSYSGKYSVMENKDDLCPHYTTKVVVFESDIVISTSIHTMWIQNLVIFGIYMQYTQQAGWVAFEKYTQCTHQYLGECIWFFVTCYNYQEGIPQSAANIPLKLLFLWWLR